MINLTRLSVATMVFASSMLLHAIPAVAGQTISSEQLRPVAGKTVAYQSYVDTNDCKAQESKSHILGTPLGIATGYYTNASFSCPNGYAMMNWQQYQAGAITTAVGGYVYGTSGVSCCKVKYKYDRPQVST